MRSADKQLGAALAAGLCASLCACGNLSNDDIAFISAIPQSGNLHLTVPAPTSQPACSIGTADPFVQARANADKINSSIESVLQIVDVVRSLTPTQRQQDERVWGPFPDNNNPGVEYEVLMLRTPWNAPGGYRYEYTFEGRRNGGEWLSVFEGNFQGATAAHGSGVLEIHFEASQALGTNKPTDPQVPVDFFYDLSGDPATVELQLTSDSFGLDAFAYQYASYKDTHATFAYGYSDANNTRFAVDSRFTSTGVGRAQLNFRTAQGLVGTLTECWDDLACVSYVNDQFNVLALCSGAPPCVRGAPSSCP